MLRRVFAFLALGIAACAVPSESEDVAETSSALSDTDPVSAAVDGSCTTAVVKGLSTQLVEEIQCLRPGTMKSIEGVAGLELGSAVFPWMQTKAAEAVIAAQRERGVTLSLNSALRTLPQQYLLYRWYQTKSCGIGLAARPGQSNHESGLAVDVDDNAAWRDVMAAHEMKWLGASDPVHFDYVGAGRVDLGGLSVLAFQKLWNRNHPEDLIAEDSTYGDETEKRLASSPVGGFPKGAECSDQPATPPAAAPPPTDETPTADATQGARASDEGEGGCTMTRTPHHGSAVLLACAAMLAISRRRSGGSARARADSPRRR